MTKKSTLAKYTTSVRSIVAMMTIMLLQTGISWASSHREAPLISNDPLADNVDLYAFRSPDDPNTVTIIATYVPMQLPHGGPNYYSFGQNIRYEIHVDNDASAVGDEVTYRFTFDVVNEDPTTFFNIRLGNQNQKTTYTLERSMDGGQSFTTIITDGVVPPNNIGPRSIESEVGLNTTYDALFDNAITDASTGEKVFAGPTDDPFFVDLGGIFDLGNAPRQAGNNVDGLACYNVSAIAIQVPIATLLKSGASPTPANILDADYVIGVWASASRPGIITLNSDSDPTFGGDFVQVSRIGMPLTNEAVIPVGEKDEWNRLTPYSENPDHFGYFYNPELALYMDDELFGGAVPSFKPLRIQKASLGMFDFTNGADGLFALKGSTAVEGTALDDAVFGTLLLPGAGQPRSVDLWPTFHTGVPNVIPYQLATGKMGNPLAAGKPFVNNFLPNGGDMLRLNMAVPVTQRNDANFSSLGLIQAAAIGLTVAPFNTTADLEFLPNMDGFPNGRRLEDDVTRIELQAVAGVVLAAVGLWYDDYDPATSPSPVTSDLLNVLSYTTGVENNDKVFRSTFPYLAMPHSGTGDCSGEVYVSPENKPMVSKRAFVSSNNQSRVGVVNSLDDRSFSLTGFVNQAGDADGIYYDDSNDVLYQLNRANNTIDLYSDVLANLDNGVPPTLVTSSTSDFSNGREIAVSGSKLVVAQDANDGNGQVNQFIIYDITTSTITLDRRITADINLWGIHLEGNTLYAIQDNSNNLVRYDDFFSNAGPAVTPSEVIAVDEIGRTHGLTYDVGTDVMILTDVGEASNATDGAFAVISDYTAAAADGRIDLSEQVKIAGPMSIMGNPVDVAYDNATQNIYIAERAAQGGMILIYDFPLVSGDASPIYQQLFAGASGVYLEGASNPFMMGVEGSIFLSSNMSGQVGLLELLEDNSHRLNSFSAASEDADGIYYDEDADVLYQLNRSDNVINAYSNVMQALSNGMTPQITATSTSDFTNGREIAVAGNRMVVAQDAADSNGQTNRMYVYEFSPTAITLKKTYNVNINLWGIHADVNTLYAIEDNSNRLAIFNNFFENADGTVMADQIVSVEGIIRTHGLTYDAGNDVMLLTDIGEASESGDGAFIVVNGFSSAIDDSNISTNEQVRISGPMSSLGNPVDIAYSPETQYIYIAERANGGGRILVFNNPELSGDATPFYNSEFAAISAVYLTGSTDGENPITDVTDIDGKPVDIRIFPNPSSQYISLEMGNNIEQNVDIDIRTVDGKFVNRITNVSNNKRVDISTLENGLYIIQIKGEKEDYQGKFFKM